MADIDPQRREALGPAERMLQNLITYSDHMVHSRPGLVIPDGRANTGVRWVPVKHKEEDGKKKVYELHQVGVRGKQKNELILRGELREDGHVVNNGVVVGRYLKPTTRAPGANPYPELAAWMYRQVADVYKMDNEFVARWASWAFAQEHKDLKVVLAAFLLVQPRKGDPIRQGDEVLFLDENYRDVGEAMCLLLRKDKRDLDAKLLLRVGKVLRVPGVAAINRELGFSNRVKKPYLGSWPKVVRRWLQYRERNPKMLEGLVRAGFRSTVIALASDSGYKAESEKFYEILRWKQKQASDGRRVLAIGKEVKAAESWDGLTETQVCEKITSDKPSWKRIVSLLPKEVGMTRAVVAAAVEVGSVSDADLVILTPTLEELGLLNVPTVKIRWSEANLKATNQRASNVARRVKSKELAEEMETAAAKAVEKVAEEKLRGIVLCVLVDVSSSMTNSVPKAVEFLSKFIGGWPLDRLHVVVFNTYGRRLTIRHASPAGVAQAFHGVAPGGGTDYASGVRALSDVRLKDDEDSFVMFVGDQDPDSRRMFDDAIKDSHLRPTAIGLIQVGDRIGDVVTTSANRLGLPLVEVDTRMFENSDPYAITRMLHNVIAATPVGARPSGGARRKTLVDEILTTDLLEKPAWAYA